jgi:hypothetical protein
MSDIDMINYGFPPQDHWRGPKLYSFEGHVPSLVTGNKKAFESVLNLFLKVAENPGENDIVCEGGRNHTSDMIILSAHRDEYIDVHYPAALKRTNTAINDSVLIHFSAGDCKEYFGGGISKAQVVRDFRKQGW